MTIPTASANDAKAMMISMIIHGLIDQSVNGIGAISPLNAQVKGVSISIHAPRAGKAQIDDAIISERH